MKTLNKLIILLIAALFATACEKHVIEFGAEPAADHTTAQFQLHYMVPLVTGAANNINRVEVNGELIANETAPLLTYNLIPSSAGKFYSAAPGTVNLKLYKGSVSDMSLAYDQSFELPAGKYNLIVHDFNEPPVVVENTVPYPKVTTEYTGTTAWVKFYNLLYEEEGVPTPLTLQYQFQYTVDNETGEKSEWANVGAPVSFGEATGWEPVTVNKTIEISSGYARIDYRIRVIGEDGSDQGSLEVRNASGNMVDYSDWWTGYVGRVYHHMLAGYRVATPTSSVRQFTAL